MALPRKKFREIVVQILFCLDFGIEGEDDLIAFVMKEMRVTRRVVREALDMARGVLARIGEFDPLIEKSSTEYGLERIPKAEKSIIRLAIYELRTPSDVPPKTVLSEAVRLTRKFATRDSARFVNAVLDAIYKDETAPAPASVLV